MAPVPWLDRREREHRYGVAVCWPAPRSGSVGRPPYFSGPGTAYSWTLSGAFSELHEAFLILFKKKSFLKNRKLLLQFRICTVINQCKCMFRNLCKFRQKICENLLYKNAPIFGIEFSLLSHWWHAEHAATFKQSDPQAGIGKLLSWP